MAVGATALVAIVAACAPADIEGTPLAGHWAPAVAVDSTEPSTCEGPATLEALDPASFPPCCDGTAHCVPTEKVPGSFRSSLEACEGGYCMPDSLLRSGGAAPPRCKAFDGSDGACISLCVPRAAEAKDVLQKDTCTVAGEVCAPCISPIDKLPTGVCEIGAAKASAACSKDAAPPPPCNAPPACTSVAGAEGRCLDASIPDVAAKKDSLPRSTCAANELCAPCFDPFDGKSTGACNQACDPGPTKPAVVFPTCCALEGTPRGHCIPNDAIPDDLEKRLSQKECSDTERCVPDESSQASFTPAACSAQSVAYLAVGGTYTGVCLSKCIELKGIDAMVVGQGNCDALHDCVPCRDPFGKATGAPGCSP